MNTVTHAVFPMSGRSPCKPPRNTELTAVTPCDLRTVATHASSLWDGFVYRRDSDDLVHIWGAGGIELHDQMAELAVLDAQLCTALFDACEFGFPGVYTYEVTEALGNAIALHMQSVGVFPQTAEWQFTLGELALRFFERGDPAELPKIKTVLQRYLPHWTVALDS